MHAKKTVCIALYNGVHFIFVWLLLSCQLIYVIAPIICSHPVLRSAVSKIYFVLRCNIDALFKTVLRAIHVGVILV
jgi:thiosulfate reductase cytochrome b subunit